MNSQQVKFIWALMATCVSCGWAEAARPASQADLVALDDYLAGWHMDGAPAEGLAILRASRGQLGPVRRAVELLLELAQVRDGTQCDQSLLGLLDEAAGAHLRPSGPGGRCGRLVEPQLASAVRQCVQYVQTEARARFEAADDDGHILARLGHLFERNYARWSMGRRLVDEAELAAYVEELQGRPASKVRGSKLRPWKRTKQPRPLERPPDHLFERYLAEPCRRFTSQVGPTLDTARRLDRLRAELKVELERDGQQSRDVQWLDWMRLVCRRSVLAMSPTARASLGAHLTRARVEPI